MPVTIKRAIWRPGASRRLAKINAATIAPLLKAENSSKGGKKSAATRWSGNADKHAAILARYRKEFAACKDVRLAEANTARDMKCSTKTVQRIL